MSKQDCIGELQRRGMNLTSWNKETVARLRTMLIENYSTAAAPQVEVDINAANVQVPTQALDLTVDFWCICKLPDDGRSYVQCSREDKCHGATDGWFHPECLDNAGWPRPRRTQKNWVCEGCDIHDNGV
jgi:hypothetical protein